jgi:hypothetical protein
VNECVITYDGVPTYAVSVMEFTGDLVTHETQYFADPFQASARRAALAEPIPDRTDEPTDCTAVDNVDPATSEQATLARPGTRRRMPDPDGHCLDRDPAGACNVIPALLHAEFFLAKPYPGHTELPRSLSAMPPNRGAACAPWAVMAARG